ncbi:MAG: hypothetical protein CMK59_13090 [Proteobacteria bacterium]|nr:hypothetical protein [Pseudomonadota bacterium]
MMTLLLLSQLAQAEGWRAKESKMFSIRYGPNFYDSELLTSIYGETGNKGLLVDAGVSLYRYVDIEVGLGYFKSEGYLLAADNSVSGVLDTLQVIPLSVAVGGRLDVLENQIIVPFGNYGRDYWLWRESWGTEIIPAETTDDSTDVETTESDSSDKERIQGGKQGSHYSYGVEILLDRFDYVGASKLKTQFGIDDTYFVIEKRAFSIGEDGLILDGKSTTFGFRFQY